MDQVSWGDTQVVLPGTPTSKSKITTKTVKKHDQPCFNLKIEKDLPNKTQVLPPQSEK